MLVALDKRQLISLHWYGTREETRVAAKDVKALFLLEKWPKFSSVIKVENLAVTDKEILDKENSWQDFYSLSGENPREAFFF